jgi:Fe-S-cluster containining protein
VSQVIRKNAGKTKWYWPIYHACGFYLQYVQAGKDFKLSASNSRFRCLYIISEVRDYITPQFIIHDSKSTYFEFGVSHLYYMKVASLHSSLTCAVMRYISLTFSALHNNILPHCCFLKLSTALSYRIRPFTNQSPTASLQNMAHFDKISGALNHWGAGVRLKSSGAHLL